MGAFAANGKSKMTNSQTAIMTMTTSTGISSLQMLQHKGADLLITKSLLAPMPDGVLYSMIVRIAEAESAVQ